MITPHILFFCESKNQVQIFKRVAKSLPSDVSVSFFYACWDGVISSWVLPELQALPPHYHYFNIFERCGDFLRESARTNARAIRSALVCAFDDVLKKLDPKHSLIVLGNDASRRGSALSHVTRNRAIPFSLMQDGFLDFVSKRGNLQDSDQNYNWGKSQADLSFVWGEAFKTALCERHGVSERSVKVSGPLKEFQKAKNTRPRAKRRSEKSVLWVDQAILDQKKAPESMWKKEFTAIAIKLSAYETTLRMHPSTNKRNQNILNELSAPYVEISDPNEPLTAEYLQQFDCVVCYYSTVFLDALAANVPCIIYKTQSIDIELPEFSHPLISYCATLNEVTEQIENISKRTASTPLKQPQIHLSHFVSEQPWSYQEIAGCLLNLLASRSDEGENNALSQLPSSLGMKSLSGKSITVISGTFGNRVGAGIPISTFINYLDNKNVSINTVLSLDNSLKHLVSQISGADLVIINSMEFFKNTANDTCRSFISYCDDRNIPIVFYIHETEYVFQSLLDSHESRIRYAISDVLPNHPVLCVSEAQAHWFNKIGILDTTVVYNASFSQYVLSKKSSGFRSENSNNVIMVGTQQPRKGVTLFSQVADLCHQSMPALKFKWYGAPVEVGRTEYRSIHAQFNAHVSAQEIERITSEASIYFLSSIDDPFPLSALEAISAGTPIVAYKNTGMSEVISTYGNGRIFHEYTPEAALEAIQKVHDNYQSYESGVEAARHGLRCQNFFQIMTTALQSALIRRGAISERTPVMRALNVAVKSSTRESDVSFDFSEINSVLNSKAGRRIDQARAAFDAGRYAQAFRISAAAFKSTPSSSLHFKILEQSVKHLDASYQMKFSELSRLRENRKS